MCTCVPPVIYIAVIYLCSYFDNHNNYLRTSNLESFLNKRCNWMEECPLYMDMCSQRVDWSTTGPGGIKSTCEISSKQVLHLYTPMPSNGMEREQGGLGYQCICIVCITSSLYIRLNVFLLQSPTYESLFVFTVPL